METNMLCAYCNAPRDGEMLTEYTEGVVGEGYYEETYVEECEGDISISCSQCKKLLYKKPIIIKNPRLR